MELDESLPRREFMKAAVAAGGASALSACLGRAPRAGDPVPEGVSDPSELPQRQHAWNDRVRADADGNVQLPRHQTFLYLTLDGSGPPGEDARETVAAALRTLDRAYERSNEGLVYSIAYSPSYFDRFDADLPDSIDLPEPRRLSGFENPTFDTQDALLHLASDRGDVVLEAEEAMFGDRSEANGIAVRDRLGDALTVDDRRTAFIGPGMPAERQSQGGEPISGIPDSLPVPGGSPLFMGFEAGFAGNQATEDYVTIREGPFADGTTKHVANLRQRLGDWYDEQSFEERVMEMFSPSHAEQGLVEGVGANLGADSGVDEFLDPETIRQSIAEHGRVGHAQKAARANRDEAGNVRILRRHVESTDDDVASLHFPSLQRRISTFEEVREAMNGDDLTDNPAIRQRVNNGILEYIFVQHRGNFLVPPRRHRALPTPRPA
ncbi:Tat pathway signal protein [Halorientalis sp. IM1011]|uniref:DUF7405 family protein n=1 Tax=Halorientalis sp. IM1011 TaxID=1932360 RepID=UPI00097CCEA1|nr:Tat pathway signal protein [Halorientalis sp. IM1011]AQL43065.1 Tat pathway signal protein [Halorientalis sp. IM1011]